MSELQRDSKEADYTTRPVPSLGTGRSFLIGGNAWTVREVIDPISLAPVLIFATTSTARRVRSYPPNWRELSEAELHALSWSR